VKAVGVLLTTARSARAAMRSLPVIIPLLGDAVMEETLQPKKRRK